MLRRVIALILVASLFSMVSAAQTQPTSNTPAPAPATPSTAPQAPKPALQGFGLEDGTPVKLRTARTISSADAHTGDTLDFEVLETLW